jgi:hypothetical protein
MGIAIDSFNDNVVKGVFIDGEYISYQIDVAIGKYNFDCIDANRLGHSDSRYVIRFVADKRNNDFKALHQALLKENPRRVIPPLPNKSYRTAASCKSSKRNRRTTELKTHYRMRMFCLYLQYLANCESLQTSPSLVQFLTGNARLTNSDVSDAAASATGATAASNPFADTTHLGSRLPAALSQSSATSNLKPPPASLLAEKTVAGGGGGAAGTSQPRPAHLENVTDAFILAKGFTSHQRHEQDSSQGGSTSGSRKEKQRRLAEQDAGAEARRQLMLFVSSQHSIPTALTPAAHHTQQNSSSAHAHAHDINTDAYDDGTRRYHVFPMLRAAYKDLRHVDR